jgi:hypothetical protein
MCFSCVNIIQTCSLDLEVELQLIISLRILGICRHDLPLVLCPRNMFEVTDSL